MIATMQENIAFATRFADEVAELDEAIDAFFNDEISDLNNPRSMRYVFRDWALPDLQIEKLNTQLMVDEVKTALQRICDYADNKVVLERAMERIDDIDLSMEVKSIIRHFANVIGRSLNVFPPEEESMYLSD